MLNLEEVADVDIGVAEIFGFSLDKAVWLATPTCSHSEDATPSRPQTRKGSLHCTFNSGSSKNGESM